MSQRRLYLDAGLGETRGVVTLDGRPERLLIARDGDDPRQALGAQVVARIRKLDRASAIAFLDLGAGSDAVLNLRPQMGRLTEGQALAVEIRAEPRAGKGASVRLLEPADGPPRLIAAGPALVDQLREADPRTAIVTGAQARAVADEAEAEALESVFPLPGGGTVAVERTRALVSIDVDLGDRPGSDSKRATRSANLAAFAVSARVLRLKSEGGLVVFDLAGRGHDGPALLAAARAAFAPDNPGVALGPISRFGTLELTVPRRRRPAREILLGPDGRPTPVTCALRLIRALEREAEADPGARLTVSASPAVSDASAPHIKALEASRGARFALKPEPGRPDEAFTISAT
ncbi:MAG: ribonuclease E/G [Caulobacterales bacterium]